MKPHPKLRKAVKWAGLGACVVWGAVFASGGLGYIEWSQAGRGFVSVGNGVLTLGWDVSPSTFVPTYGPSGTWNRTGWEWWPWGMYDDSMRAFAIPAWMPLALFAPATTIAWLLDTRAKRRARVGKCIACGYDLRGLTPGAPCPECGRAAGDGVKG